MNNIIKATFFYLGRFLKKLADDQYSSITKDSIYHIKHMYIQPFTTIVDWPEIVCFMEVSTMFHICRYCIFTWWGSATDAVHQVLRAILALIIVCFDSWTALINNLLKKPVLPNLGSDIWSRSYSMSYCCVSWASACIMDVFRVEYVSNAVCSCGSFWLTYSLRYGLVKNLKNDNFLS